MNEESKKTSCCSGKPSPKPCCQGKKEEPEKKLKWGIFGEYVTGRIETNEGPVPRVAAQLNRSDKWEGMKVRMNINRMNYSVTPGIYAVGNPGKDSIVLVTSNYKLTFDSLRKELNNLDAWILVLDTRGINVWCAAGKGTFGTDELVNRIEETGLKNIVSHRRLIVPQLGATGISAHEVRERSGFTVLYGPVRASDIPAYLQANMKTTPEMRKVTFNLIDRLTVAPVEISQGLKIMLIICFVMFLLSGISTAGYLISWPHSIFPVINVIIAYFCGTLIAPALLPWLPGRSFSLKGAWAGVIGFACLYILGLTGNEVLRSIGWLLLIIGFSSFLTLNFTGASTYTSLSGVKREMRFAIPTQIAVSAAGALLWISGIFFHITL